MNVLLVTLDQFRGDCLSSAGHPLVRTPNLDRLAAQGVRLARHYSQSSPCSPGRACLYTGTYQLNNRVVANGTPLDARFDNLALAARRAGYAPTLFGYTDQAIDPRQASGPDDPRLSTYEGVLPGFEVGLELTGDHAAWIEWLRKLGYPQPVDADEALALESERPLEHSASSFLTDHLVAWLESQRGPFFAHASYFRPHPPYAAAGRFAHAYDPAAIPLPIAPAENRHPLHEGLMRHPQTAAPQGDDAIRRLRAQYLGMVSEVDHQLGRVWQALERLGRWEDTWILVTSDHGEDFGDHGLIGKSGFFEGSYHVLGILRDPRKPTPHGSVVTRFTENVDVFPTLCDALGIDTPAQCDGLPWTPFLRGESPPWWREEAHWEFDWRFTRIPHGPHVWPWDRRLERQHLAVLRGERCAYVQFGDGSFRCFDLAADPTWRTEVSDPGIVLAQAQAMLTWRSQHTERTLTGMLAEQGGIGRWPPMPASFRPEK
ncbi:MAG: sulfatase-like hydrolase/transferase [Myxococcota bacterium]